jgi:hypothetical protein
MAEAKKDTVVLQTSDDEMFTVERKVAERSALIKSMMEGESSFHILRLRPGSLSPCRVQYPQVYIERNQGRSPWKRKTWGCLTEVIFARSYGRRSGRGRRDVVYTLPFP